MKPTTIDDDTFRTHPGAGIIQVTQYGIRTPDGAEHWGNLRHVTHAVAIPVGPYTVTVYAHPDWDEHNNSNYSLAVLRGKIRESLRGGFLADEDAIPMSERAVRIERVVLISTGETTTSTTESKEN